MDNIDFLGCNLFSNAQSIEHDGTIYIVKKERIYLNGEDITDTFTSENRELVLHSAAQKLNRTKIRKKEEKKARKLEKQQKKAEKKDKKG